MEKELEESFNDFNALLKDSYKEQMNLKYELLKFKDIINNSSELFYMKANNTEIVSWKTFRDHSVYYEKETSLFNLIKIGKYNNVGDVIKYSGFVIKDYEIFLLALKEYLEIIDSMYLYSINSLINNYPDTEELLIKSFIKELEYLIRKTRS